MSPERRDGGVPHAKQKLSTSSTSEPETWLGANDEKVVRLRLRGLKRRAGEQGLELRHSAYGYALFDTTRNMVNDRNDMSLSEIDTWLKRSLKK